jgi:ribosome-associated protein
MLQISPTLSIPERELSYRTSTSSGPGGQNVNKVETRVTVLFDLAGSETLDDDQKRLVRARLASRIDKRGLLRVVSQKHRFQAANRAAARERLALLLAAALAREPERRPTRQPESARRRRLEDKRRRSRLKQLRRPVDD